MREMPDEGALRRMQWRARRGLLELDIFLQPFVARRYQGLSEEEKLAFEALLDLPDSTLWDMMSGRVCNEHPAQAGLLEMIRNLE